MEEFETYVKSNWNVPNAAACGITYTHATRIVTNKSKVPVKNHSVNLTISWHDKDNVQLQTEKLSFLNDDMSKIVVDPSEDFEEFAPVDVSDLGD